MSACAVVAALLMGQAVPERSLRIAVGGQLGFPHVMGAVGRGTFSWAGKPRFDVDVLWEPSAYLQSYSIGGAWRPGDWLFGIGPRVRLMQFGPPWGRGADRAGVHLGLGLDATFAIPVAGRGSINLGVQATVVPTQGPSLRGLMGLFAGFTWSIFELR